MPAAFFCYSIAVLNTNLLCISPPRQYSHNADCSGPVPLSLFVSVQQVIFTTELIHMASVADHTVVNDTLVKEPVMGDMKTSGSQCQGNVSDIGVAVDDIGVECNRDISSDTASADQDMETSEIKPVKIIFKDYFAKTVRYQLHSLHSVCLLMGE